jgi:hypothetical protein
MNLNKPGASCLGLLLWRNVISHPSERSDHELLVEMHALLRCLRERVARIEDELVAVLNLDAEGRDE